MPSRNTFTIKPFKQLLERYISGGGNYRPLRQQCEGWHCNQRPKPRLRHDLSFGRFGVLETAARKLSGCRTLRPAIFNNASRRVLSLLRKGQVRGERCEYGLLERLQERDSENTESWRQVHFLWLEQQRNRQESWLQNGRSAYLRTRWQQERHHLHG